MTRTMTVMLAIGVAACPALADSQIRFMQGRAAAYPAERVRVQTNMHDPWNNRAAGYPATRPAPRHVVDEGSSDAAGWHLGLAPPTNTQSRCPPGTTEAEAHLVSHVRRCIPR